MKINAKILVLQNMAMHSIVHGYYLVELLTIVRLYKGVGKETKLLYIAKHYKFQKFYLNFLLSLFVIVVHLNKIECNRLQIMDFSVASLEVKEI